MSIVLTIAIVVLVVLAGRCFFLVRQLRAYKAELLRTQKGKEFSDQLLRDAEREKARMEEQIEELEEQLHLLKCKVNGPNETE